MKLLVTLLGLCFLSAVPAGAATGTAPQPLSISVRGDGARAITLPAYDPGLPIAIAVQAVDGQHFDALSVSAIGPAGTSQEIPLVRTSEDHFSGSLSLADPGTWNLRLFSRSGNLDTGTTPITLDVQAPPPTYAGLIGWAVGAAIFIVVGGGGFLILRRAAHPSPTANLEQAA